MIDRAHELVAPVQTPGSSLRERLAAAAALIGAPIVVTDDATWEVTSRGIRVGLGYFAARGHSESESSALALLELWGAVRFPKLAPERARRRDSILNQRPELAPLLDVTLRLQAAAELLTVLPSMREALTAAAYRSLPASLLEWPRHLQWAGLLLQTGLAGPSNVGFGGGTQGVDPSVAEEWRRLQRGGAAGTDPVRRAIAPDPTRAPLLRWERVLALVLPPFDRLRALDLADRGIGQTDQHSPSSDSGGDDDEPSLDDAVSAGSSAGDDDAEANRASDESSASAPSAPPDATSDRARAGDGQDRTEGADLFAAEQAGFVQTILATPMPAEGALLLDNFDLPEDARAESADVERGRAAGSGNQSGAASALDYAQRVHDLSEAIERMRDVWARVITERVAERRLPGRRASDAGDTLHTESLAGAVAQAIAGVPRPHAFVHRESRPRRTQRAGSTDYVLLVDRSASMQGLAAASASDAALIMIEALAGAERDIAHAETQHGIDLELDIRTALVVFDAQAIVVKPLSRGLDDAVRHELVSAIRSPRGSTNDGLALHEAARQLGVSRVFAGSDAPRSDVPASDGIERRRIVLFIGDGGSNDPVLAARELRRLHEAGVQVIGIGIGSDEIVERFAPTSRRVDDPRTLPEILYQLVVEELA